MGRFFFPFAFVDWITFGIVASKNDFHFFVMFERCFIVLTKNFSYQTQINIKCHNLIVWKLNFESKLKKLTSKNCFSTPLTWLKSFFNVCLVHLMHLQRKLFLSKKSIGQLVFKDLQTMKKDDNSSMYTESLRLPCFQKCFE